MFETIMNETALVGWSIQRAEVPWYSSGIIKIIRNVLSLRKESASIYHITGDIHYAVFAFPRRKTILTIHDSVFIYQSKGLKRWVFLHLYLKWPARYASAITTISEQSKTDIIKFSNCDPSKIKVIPDPLNSFITFSKKPFNKSKPVILFIGSTPNKNLPRVLEAIAGISCHLELIGKFPSEQLQRIKQLELSHSISVGISEDELNRKYGEADILLFPSLFEGFGLPIVEAQQAGKVVITSNMGPMNEVAGKGACIVNPMSIESIREGLIKVISDDKYREQLINLGTENCKRFSAKTVSAEYLAVYDKILK
ncbi:MAG TPA: glycosyltransferase family 1 protein [Ignavibacteriaceae bacterium]